MTVRRALLAAGAGLALADASVVTLALPPILRELQTSVEGVAAVIGVYTLVVAVGLLPAAAVVRRAGPGVPGLVAGAAFAAASALGAVAGSLGVLLAARAVQGLAAAGLLATAFVALDGAGRGRRLWLAVSVFGTAAGPALGGAITQALDWRAIFALGVPVGLGFAWAARSSAAPGVATRGEHRTARAALALGALAAALTAVLFLLVLELVAGWNLDPLGAAAAVSVLPITAALAHALAPGLGEGRAAVGCLLVGAGTLALAFVPRASAGWVILPELLAGAGMGLALPALAGVDDARALTIRHAGITLALLALAPIVAHQLDSSTERARERGVALVLDAPLSPQRKLDLGPSLVAGVDAEEPRAGLARAVRAAVASAGNDRTQVADLGRRADDTLVTAVGEAFRPAFLLAGLLALLAALATWTRAVPLLAAAALALPAAQALVFAARAPPVPTIGDPCRPRAVPSTGGLSGLLQTGALQALDRAACKFGSSREELVLALADPADRRRFEERHGVDPESIGGILQGLGL